MYLHTSVENPDLQSIKHVLYLTCMLSFCEGTCPRQAQLDLETRQVHQIVKYVNCKHMEM